MGLVLVGQRNRSGNCGFPYGFFIRACGHFRPGFDRARSNQRRWGGRPMACRRMAFIVRGVAQCRRDRRGSFGVNRGASRGICPSVNRVRGFDPFLLECFLFGRSLSDMPGTLHGIVGKRGSLSHVVGIKTYWINCHPRVSLNHWMTLAVMPFILATEIILEGFIIKGKTGFRFFSWSGHSDSRHITGFYIALVDVRGCLPEVLQELLQEWGVKYCHVIQGQVLGYARCRLPGCLIREMFAVGLRPIRCWAGMGCCNICTRPSVGIQTGVSLDIRTDATIICVCLTSCLDEDIGELVVVAW